MQHDESKKDSWSDYWLSEGADGEVFVNQKGQKHQELKAVWRKFFDAHPSGKLLDIASGAGSIFADTDNLVNYDSFAADLSSSALALLKQKFPSVSTIECSADKVPLQDGTMDLLVSQFGIEYSGLDGFKEACRLIADGGKIQFVCHIKDGRIYKPNFLQLEGAKLVKSLDFIAKAKAMVTADFVGNPEQSKPVFEAFTGCEPILAEYNKQFPQGVHHHLYTGFKKMMLNRAAYLNQDILDWLDAMVFEVEKSISRRNEICRAALDIADIEAIKEIYANHNLQNIHAKPIYLPDEDLPLAWLVRADKKL